MPRNCKGQPKRLPYNLPFSTRAQPLLYGLTRKQQTVVERAPPLSHCRL
jgi:hypothetical protein